MLAHIERLKRKMTENDLDGLVAATTENIHYLTGISSVSLHLHPYFGQCYAVITRDAPERVTLEVQGPSSKVRDLSESRVSVILDLSGVSEPGQRTFTLDQSNVFLPVGVRLNRAVPAQIRMRFETRMSKEVPVRVNLASPPPAGYRVLSQVVSPQMVRIEGPESRVKVVTEADTDPIDISNVVGVKEFRVNLFVNDPMIRLANVTGVMVRIDVGLDQGPATDKKSKK